MFIIHSGNADTKESFGPYVVNKAKNLGFDVIFPDFPHKGGADYQKWSAIMDQYITSGKLNDDSIVIGHSLGTLFIPKYLSERQVGIKVFISVAGFLGYTEGREDLKKIVDDFAPTDEEIIKSISLMQNRYAIYSDNDHLNTQEQMETYAKKLNMVQVFIPKAGHFGTRSGIKELPEIFKIIKKIKEKR